MTNPVFDAQPPASAGPEFEVYTPPAFTPEQQPVVPVPPKRKRTGLVVLTVLVVLLFGAAGALGVLLVQEKDRTSGLSEQVEGKDRDIADLTGKVKNGEDDTARAVSAQKKAEADVVAAQKCRDAAKEIKAALVANDEKKGETAIMSLLVEC